jgi:FkbM family methyltransferase
VTEPLTTSDLRDAIQQGDTVVDIGVYIGVHTVVAAQAVGPTGRVYSIEPDPTAVRMVQKTLRGSGLNGRVTLIHAAAGDRNGVVRLERRTHDPSMNTIMSGVGTYEVDMVVPDDQIEHADVVKIDVEGAEMLVMAGMRRLLASARVLIVECAPQLLADATPADLVQQVRAFGFRSIVVNDDRRCTREPWPTAIRSESVNFFCTR